MVFHLILANLILICKHKANHNMVNELWINVFFYPFVFELQYFLKLLLIPSFFSWSKISGLWPSISN